ncbi:retropepsin-like aspartic protease family protein [Sphingomonas sp. TX0543]|uniref:retropepsin-like aspartic protease family protein n=1 Tax=Sphingomonas sp. TX0543 TaxID=3399682 RepID=UPI003AFAAF36
MPMRTAMLLMIAAGTVIGLALPGARPGGTARAKVDIAAVASSGAAPNYQRPRETVIQRDDSGHFYAFATVNNEPVRFVVDTGATTVALTAEDARRAHVSVDPSQFVPVGYGAGGEVRGQPVTLDRIELDGKAVGAVRAVVLPDLRVSLLGQSYLRQIGSVSISNNEMRLK